MINFFFAEQEIILAKEDLQKLKTTSEPLKLERLFANIADYLGKAFNKLLHVTHGSQGELLKTMNEAKHKRKIDPLLKYLHHVRNANQHTGVHLADFEIISRTPIDYVTITRIGKDENGNEMKIDEQHPLYPSKLQLKPVRDSGQIYSPPMYHNGTPLKYYYDPFEVASLGISYYENLLSKMKKINHI